MQRTKILKLQKPEPGDEYNSDTFIKNYRTIDRVMANIGGNVARRDININKVFKNSANVTLTGGGYTIYGNGMAFIEVNFSNKKALSVDNKGLVSGDIQIGELFPEFAPAITQPLTSGGVGMAVTGYIYQSPARINIKLLKGKVTNGISAGTVMQLSGFYPLSEVPSNIGLEYMNPRTFDFEVHNRNLHKIDSVAKKLKTSMPFKQLDPKNVKAASGFKIVGDPHLTRNTNGMVAMSVTVEVVTPFPFSANGDVANTIVATIQDSNWWPNRYVKTVSTASGRLAQGEIKPQNGEISIGSFAGDDTINKGDQLSFTANWVYDGN